MNTKTLSNWVIGTLCTVCVTMFGLWRDSESRLFEVQKKCDEDKIEAGRTELKNLHEFYEQVKADQLAQIQELKKQKRK